MKLSIEQLRKDFRYEPETGHLFRLRAAAAHHEGRVPLESREQLRHFGHVYMATHLIWAIVHGYWPTKLIDHRDGNKANLRLDNLREATHQQNQFNKVAFGQFPKGVVFKGDAKRAKPYAAVIRIAGRKTTLGHFKTAEEAGLRYMQAAQELQGDFALHNR